MNILNLEPCILPFVSFDFGAEGRRDRHIEFFVESTETRAGRICVTLREPNAQQLTAFLVGLGFRVSGVIPHRRTLQDYFLKVLNE